ncbi:MAG: hypothetical protein N838_15480 [Thiohalocapsa sp. PB-PSB1]|jgi:hypothetical protein|nr:MAG: hypothetical protein N838_15480 [Thiohalocapsa sp. PB-PSB1]
MHTFVSTQMDYVIFVYGLAFFLLGAACLSMRARAFLQLPWGWLAAFAFSHGSAEWLDLAALGFGRNQTLSAIKIVLIIASFVFLFQFALAGLAQRRTQRVLGYAVLGVALSLVAVAASTGGLTLLEISARWLLGLPGGLLAAVAIDRTRASSQAGSGPWLVVLAAFTMLYAVLTGAIAPTADFFPVQVLNDQHFLQLTGVPVQVFRAFAAVVMAIALWIASEAVRNKAEEKPSRYTLALAAIMLILVTSGWGLTEALTRQSYNQIAIRGNHQADALAQIVDTGMQRLQQAAQLLTVNSAIIEIASNPQGARLPIVNLVLDQATVALQLEVAYLLDTSGNVIASSNRNAPDSFVGRNYAFRPYFQAAVKGSGANYLALGVTSGIFGHYASAPVRDLEGQVRLVAVLKSRLPSLASVAKQATDCMLLSPLGVVIDACDQRLNLRSLWPLSTEDVKALIDSRQFGPGPFRPLLGVRPKADQILLWRGRQAMYVNAPLSLEGWSVALLMPLREARTYRLFGIGTTLILSLLAIFAYVLLHGHEVYERRLGSLMEQLRDQSQIDPLTQLPNRGWFHENFERELRKSQRLGNPLALGNLEKLCLRRADHALTAL